MTQREFLNAVIAIEGLDNSLVDYANSAIAKLDKSNAQKSAKAAEKRAEKAVAEAPLYEAVEAMLNDATVDSPVTASMVAGKLDISTSKATVILKSFVDSYVAEVKEYKFKETGKSARLVKGYYKSVVEA